VLSHYPRSNILLPAFAAAALSLLASNALAQNTSDPRIQISTNQNAAQGPLVTAELIADTSNLVPGKVHRLGIVLKMKPGWHTYWANPGDSGMSISVELDLPKELQAAPIQYPAPRRYVHAQGMMVDYIYENVVTLQIPIYVSPDLEFPQRVTLKANVEWLVCQEACIPGSQQIELTIPVFDSQPRIDSRTASLFADSNTRIPTSAKKSRNLSVRWSGTTLVAKSPGATRITAYPLSPLFPTPLNIATTGQVDGDVLTLEYPDTLPKGSTIWCVLEIEGGPDPGIFIARVGTDPRLKTTNNPANQQRRSKQ
jgi:DsbC/DsbD-like thiol-disulfide interchange protein